MITLIGKNTDFMVTFDGLVYTVYKCKILLVGNKYKFSDVKSYLN